MAQRTTAQTFAWFDTHRTKQQLGFDPDGQCLKIARTARNIPSKYPSAISAAHATPLAARRKLTQLKPGMVAYYDDPHDSNPYGHIVTVRWVAPIIKSPYDIIVETNSVKSDNIVKVRGNYFPTHWGDSFLFGATMLNGVNLLLPHTTSTVPQQPASPGKLGPVAEQRIKDAIAELQHLVAVYKNNGNTRVVTALQRDIAELQETLKNY